MVVLIGESMKDKNISYFELFYTLFIINAFTFGGGYTIVPIIKDKFVNDLDLIDEKQMLNIVSFGQSVPGAMAISTSFLVGYKLKGFLGAIVAVLGAILPCIFVISLISYAYISFISNEYIRNGLKGIGAVVSAVLLVTVIKMVVKLLKNKKRVFYMSVFLFSFILSFMLNIHIAIILIISASVGLIFSKEDIV